MQEETLKKHIEDMVQIRENLSFKASKIAEFKTKLDVKLDGDSINGSYSIKVSHHPRPLNTIEQAVVDKLVRDYELNIDNEVCIINKTIDLLETIGTKRSYCEVDLFNMEKPPVEC